MTLLILKITTIALRIDVILNAIISNVIISISVLLPWLLFYYYTNTHKKMTILIICIKLHFSVDEDKIA